MALVGLSVTFGYVEATPAPSAGASPKAYGPGVAPIYGPSSDSEVVAAGGGTTTKISTASSDQLLRPMVSLISSVAMWVTIGKDPSDPSSDKPSGGRRYIPAIADNGGQSIDICCSPGDKVRGYPA